MDLLQIIILSLIQGITEFLPISSSAHLILAPSLFGWEDQGLAFDVALHLGTLTAVTIYFWRDIKNINRRLALMIVLATIPVGLAGLLFKSTVETVLRDPWVIIFTTIFYGILLGVADKCFQHQPQAASKLSWRNIIIIGCAQALALVPGTSRSGITMTAGLMCGLSRSMAARFSLWLSIPVISLAGGLNLLELAVSNKTIDWYAFGLGFSISAVTAYFCIKLFLAAFEKIGMLPFVIYRIALGIFLIILLA